MVLRRFLIIGVEGVLRGPWAQAAIRAEKHAARRGPLADRNQGAARIVVLGVGCPVVRQNRLPEGGVLHKLGICLFRALKGLGVLHNHRGQKAVVRPQGAVVRSRLVDLPTCQCGNCAHAHQGQRQHESAKRDAIPPRTTAALGARLLLLVPEGAAQIFLLIAVPVVAVVLFFRRGIMGDREITDLFKKRPRKAAKEAVK